MKDLIVLLIHLLATLAKLLGPGGAKAVVADSLLMKQQLLRVLARYYHPAPGTDGGPSWLTFIGHMKDSLWSVDLFRCESITLKTHWVLVVMDQFSRRIVGFGVHAGDVDGIALCCMFNKAISKIGTPKYLSSDNDPLFQYHRWKANLRIMNVEEVKSVPYIPLSHPFVERLIGTVRREFLDHTLFWTASDLERKLEEFRYYYNHHRVHDSLKRNTPAETSRESTIRCTDLSNYGWMTLCRGLYQLPTVA
jgi:transposase InsO family protein